MWKLLYKRGPFFFLLAVLIPVSLIGQEQRSFEDDSIKVFYHTMEGRVEGPYESFYPNGQKKAEGQFDSNYRIGEWTIWDETGNKRIIRDYSSPFEFEKKYPEVSKEGSIPMPLKSINKISYNQEGFIELFPLKANMIKYYKRYMRFLEEDNNPILFEDDLLIKTIYEGIADSSITAYYEDERNDPHFTRVLEASMIDMKNYEVVKFHIKEDCMFDNVRFVNECRIIGIGPEYRIDSNSTDFFWIYYPEARSAFAKQRINSKEVPAKIKSLDDLFFYRYFSSTIQGWDGIYDFIFIGSITKEEIEKESERIELKAIESEHDLWFSLSDKK